MGKPIDLLLNTGSVGCIIAEKFMKQLGLKIDQPSKIVIIDINGNHSSPKGEVNNLTIELGDGNYITDKALVVDLNDYNILVGNHWLDKVKAEISFLNRIMKYYHRDQEYYILITCQKRKISPYTEEFELEDEEPIKFQRYIKGTIETKWFIHRGWKWPCEECGDALHHSHDYCTICILRVDKNYGKRYQYTKEDEFIIDISDTESKRT